MLFKGAGSHCMYVHAHPYKSPTHLQIAMIDTDLGYLEVTEAGPLLPETTSQVPFSVLTPLLPSHSFSDYGGLAQKWKIKLAGNRGIRMLFMWEEQVRLERPLESVSASHPPPFHTRTPPPPPPPTTPRKSLLPTKLSWRLGPQKDETAAPRQKSRTFTNSQSPSSHHGKENRNLVALPQADFILNLDVF